MKDDLISRQAAIDELDVDAELLRRVLDDADIVGAERAKYAWGLGLIESYISDMKDLPSIDAVQVIRCKDCKHRYIKNDVWTCPFGLMSGPDGYCSWAERKEE